MPAFATRTLRLITSTASSWNANNSSTAGAALAFYSAFSLAPLLVIILTLAGWIVGEQFAYGQVSGSTGLTSLRHQVASRHATMVGALGLFDFVASLAIVATLFALIFRYMPARRTAWKSALIGGLLTALLFDIGRWAIGLYLSHSTQPSAFGAAASFVALLLWLYYTAQIFLFGAEFTASLAGVHRERRPASAGPG
jgi:uncharacterized BrkB/YihY/UPF0761 family membrane protein